MGDMVTSDPHKGLGMGLGWEHLKDLVKGTNVTPDFECEPSRDPQLGFEGQRKIREPPKIALEEMKALKIPVPDRGYCMDELAAYYKCYHKHMPFLRTIVRTRSTTSSHATMRVSSSA